MTHVAISGAGPVGTSLALALLKAGLDVTLFEKAESLPADPRAATLQPPTLEMLDRLGTGAEIIGKGLKAPVFQFRDRASDSVIAEFDYGHLAGETPHSYALQCEQFKVADTNAQAIETLRAGTLRLGTEVVSFGQTEDAVSVRYRDHVGEHSLKADYLVGCDGGRSLIRKGEGIAFEGFTYEERFLVLTTPHDFFQRGFQVRNYVLDPSQWCALFKVPHDGPPGLWRTVFPAPAGDSGIDALSNAYVTEQLTGLQPDLGLEDITHRNIYAVNQRVAAVFRKGRVFLAGDAAHVNNPLGGLGMNSGIHDAMNLADKLVQATADPQDAETLFDAYDAERRQIAKDYVQAQTIQNKKRLEAKTSEQRAAARAELQGTCGDPVRHKAWVMNASLLTGLRQLTERQRKAS